MKTSYQQLCDVATGRVVVPRLELADSTWKRSIGLLFRTALAEDSGLWLSPCNGIHTLGMRFTLDVVFMDGQGNALRLAPAVRPWRFCGPVWGARAVIELPNGTIRRQELVVGRCYRSFPCNEIS